MQRLKLVFLAPLALYAFAADLVLKDPGGHKVRLSEHRGKVVVLNFWATWCAPCIHEMPLLVAAEKRYAARGVVFVGASLDDAKSKSKVPDFVAKYGISFPVWLGATADDLVKLSMGNAAPATAFLDRDGRILFRISGEFREPEVDERLEWLLGPRTTPPPEAMVRHLEN